MLALVSGVSLGLTVSSSCPFVPRADLPATISVTAHHARSSSLGRLVMVQDAPTVLPEPEAGANKVAKLSPAAVVNRSILRAKVSEEILSIDVDQLSAVNVATALHRLAVINKTNRAGRDSLLRDARFQALIDAVVDNSAKLSPRSVSDVLWSCATLQHWPAVVLKPLLTAVAELLAATEALSDKAATSEAAGEEVVEPEVGEYMAKFEEATLRAQDAEVAPADGAPRAFEPQHLSTMVWALARLECKPTRLLERIEALAAGMTAGLNMQNCANLLWGFAKLNYVPVTLLPALADAMLERKATLIDGAKPVEVSDTAFALGILAHDRRAFADALGGSAEMRAAKPLLLALAERASPDGVLGAFSSRQVVVLIWAFARLKLTDELPAGRLDEWVSAVRVAHEATPLLARDARNLERSLEALGLDATWIKRSEMLNVWKELAAGRGGPGREFTDAELRNAFDVIDTDKSGDIDVSELTEALRAINPDADDATIDGMIALGDVDGDKEISFYEFKKILTSPAVTKEGAAAP